MKILQAINNGNVDCIDRSEINYNLNWISGNYNISESYDNFNTGNIVNNDTRSYITNRNINYENNTQVNSNNSPTEEKSEQQTEHLRNVNTDLVFNKQYTINVKNNINLLNSVYSQNQTSILETFAETAFLTSNRYQGDPDVSVQPTPNNEERAFDQSDTDEASENGTETRVPRGIVNPNYPGFQHYAHTLQDYSSNIENFYQSENEMTDDDIDVDIVDSSVENSISQTVVDTDDLNANYTNNFSKIESNINTQLVAKYATNLTINDNLSENIEKYANQEVPDLLKNVTNVNNNNDNNDCATYFDLNYSDTDIENNFHTKDIIGDFNKEIEEEIKQVLNYSINIEDDLEELRKDIKDSFAKPIENTINNISDVVNHVIKKLVKTQTDTNDMPNENVEPTSLENNQNIINIKKEINMSRPSFLYLENKFSSELSDAFLSDGKDAINIEEYDTEKISNNVENTIKQLSFELRRIIPKLDELSDHDRLLVDGKVEATSTEANSNNAVPNVTSSKVLQTADRSENVGENIGSINKNYNESDIISKPKSKHKSATRTSRDTRGDPNLSIIKSATVKKNMKTSVRKVKSNEDEDLGSFDVYNIETAMPTLDIDAIESHLKAAKEAERRKRNDREEIRRRLAMGVESDEYYSMGHIDHPRKKPSLHSRMQNGKNLQICFMNETASDNEYQLLEVEKNCNKPLIKSSIFSKSNYSLNNHPYQTRPLSVNITKHDRLSTGEKTRPSSVPINTPKSRSSHSLGHIDLKESDFFALQATLQTEARIALAQAKEMARLQMERERRVRAVSPVTEMLRRSMEKANAPLASDRRRVSRQLLTDMNIAQLQVIVNELHSQIESLNESLVTLLMSRDDLHMGQDSMLVDIEDLTRYLGVKEQTKKTKGNTKSAVKRFASLVHK